LNAATRVSPRRVAGMQHPIAVGAFNTMGVSSVEEVGEALLDEKGA